MKLHVLKLALKIPKNRYLINTDLSSAVHSTLYKNIFFKKTLELFRWIVKANAV